MNTMLKVEDGKGCRKDESYETPEPIFDQIAG